MQLHQLRPVSFRVALILPLSIVVLAVSINVVAQNRRSSQSIIIQNCRVKVIDEVQLASARSGILAEVAKPGTYVKAGSIVAQLRDSLVRAAVAIAEQEATNDIETRFTKKAAELAQLKHERTTQANRVLPGTVTELELRELRLDAEKSLLQLEQAQHQFKVAGLRYREQLETLKTLRIEAPFDAFVRTVHKQPGEVVSEGETILEIINTRRMRVDGYVEFASLGNLRQGDAVEITLPGQSQIRFKGRVGFVDQKVEPVSQKVHVWADVENHNGLLRDGVKVTMTIYPSASNEKVSSLRR